MDSLNRQFKDVLILGAGPAGLSAGYTLSQSGSNVLVIERQSQVGGLTRTIEHHGFRFDLGGHRFLTDNPELDALIRDLIGDDLLLVGRSSQILLNGRLYDYPLTAHNALSTLGLGASLRIITDYLWEQLRQPFDHTPVISLEDWVVRHFGRSLFNLFFKEYSEKVWGVPCDQIAAEWVARRIQGLSLGVAIRGALARSKSRSQRTLAEQFMYPRLGIGQICDRLQQRIDHKAQVMTDVCVSGINHSSDRIESVTVKDENGQLDYTGYEIISSIPLTTLVHLFNPLPPEEILQAADALRFRDLVVVTVMLDRESVTDQTWMYIPDHAVPFGRIHEPTNWSHAMAPEGKTHLVVEYYCFRGDNIWASSDDELAQLTVSELSRLGFIQSDEVIECASLRIPRAYPLFEVGYLQKQRIIIDYMSRFSNLELAGRGGQFEYYNTDHAMESGIAAARTVLTRLASPVIEIGSLSIAPGRVCP